MLEERGMMPKESILIVEDDKNISKLVKYNLDKAGYECVVTDNGEDALRCLGNKQYSLVILDIMLPGMNGLEVCKAMRRQEKFKSLPVIMLTARGEEVDRIVGFELGADDYIVKPFSPRELTLRVKAVLKRMNPAEDEPEEVITAGPIRVDVARHEVYVEKKRIELTSMEFKLLAIIMKRAGRVQSRERLLADVWDISSDVTTRTVDTHVKRLREKLGKAGGLIETIRGTGYKFLEKG